MRLAVVSHSLVAPRQQIFWDYFGTLPGVQLLQLYPARWQTLSREGGVDVSSYDMFGYRYGKGAWKRLRDFEPNLVYVQEEVYSQSARQMVDWATRLPGRPKIGVFVWENLHEAEVKRDTPEGITFIVAGNREAKRIHGAAYMAPQVGIDFDLFKPTDRMRPFNILFASRKDHSKGWDLFQQLPYMPLETTGESYRALPDTFNTAKVHIVLSHDTPVWKEQFLPYVNVEALACGLSCVAAEVEAVKEWSHSCPGFTLVPPQDDVFGRYPSKQLLDAVASSLQDWQVNVEGRQWAKARFSKEAVGETLLNIFRQYVN